MPKKPEAGFAPLIVLILVAAIGVGAYFLKPWEKFNNLSIPQFQTPEAVQPKLDLKFAQTIEVDPQKGATIRSIDSKLVLITLEIPPNALKKKEKITLIPFEATSSATSTQGVLIGPENLIFLEPVTLTFSFNLSEIKNDAPERLDLKNPRTFGKSQVLRFDPTNKTLTQILISRPMELKTILPSRITRGGVYVFSLDGKYQKELAKLTLTSDKSSISSRIEAAINLVSLGVKLTSKEVEIAKAAADKILALENPALIELSAAGILDKKLKQFTSYLINTVLAQSSLRGYIDFRCRLPQASYQDILRAAVAAQTFGYQDLYESCILRARDKLKAQKDDILKNASNVGELVQLLNDYQLLGLDESSQNNNTDPFPNQIHEKINKTLNNKLAQLTDPNYGRIPVEEREGIRDLGKLRKYGFDPTIVGMLIGEGLGLQTFDEAGLTAFGDAWIPGFLEAEQSLVEGCNEMLPYLEAKGQQLCTKFILSGRFRSDILQVQQDIHKGAEDVGKIQSEQDKENAARELEELDKYYRETLPQEYGIEPVAPITYPSTDEEWDIKYKAPIDDEQPGYEVDDTNSTSPNGADEPEQEP